MQKRRPLDLIDEIEALSPGEAVVVHTLRADEPYLRDHFPAFPLMPGVLMLELMLQAARHVLGDADATLGEVRNLRFARAVRPGDRLRIRVTQRADDPLLFEAEGEVGGEAAVRGRFALVSAAGLRHDVGDE